MNSDYIVGLIHGKQKERSILAQKYADAKEEIEKTFTPEYCATSNEVIKNRIFSILSKHMGEELGEETVAEEQSAWIPMSQKWPSVNTEVITSDEHGNIDIMTMYYDEGEDGGYGFEDTYGNIHEVDTIVAWQAAPKHYKENGNGD